jgi:hypothetical protein
MIYNILVIMHGKEYLINKINTIFDAEEENFRYYQTFTYIEEKFRHDSYEDKIKIRPTIEWDTYETLKKLYNKIEKNPSDKELFIEILKNKIITGYESYKYHNINNRDSSRYHNTASLAFYFLLNMEKYNEIVDSLSALSENIQKNSIDDLKKRDGFFTDILSFLINEAEKFNEPVLDALAKLNSSCSKKHSLLYDKVKSNIINLKYSKLNDELTGINEEINLDKERVIDIIKIYGFPQEMETFLLEIDQISQIADWETGSSALIASLRTFFERIIINTSDKIKEKTQEKFSVDPDNPRESDMGRRRKYIRKYLKLSDKDDDFINAFINILNHEGSHALISEKKYFFMNKNIGIEIAYFLLSKYEEFGSVSKFL